MHPFRLAKLVAGVVLVTFATFAAQRVFAGSVEPSILESENGSLVSCNSEGRRSLRAPEREPVSDPCERSGRDGASARLSHCDLVAGSLVWKRNDRQGLPGPRHQRR